jgi:ABC transporter substrate binding protein (PQQ-dependent alcohol dehydrogenase system)
MTRSACLLSLLGVTLAVCLAPGHLWAQDDAAEIEIGYLRLDRQQLTLSLIDLPAEDAGLAGARLAIDDNNTTGQFTRQRFVLEDATVSDGEDAVEAASRMAAEGIGFIVADLPADMLLAVTDRVADDGALVFNVTAADDRLRGTDCHASLIHVAPSRTMLADALAQYLVWKQWSRWFLLVGSHPEDEAFADAVRRAAGRFGGQIVEERVYEDTGGARRTDSGHVQVQRQMPVFTQGASAHDVVIVADENEVFGAYVPFRTWDPRPVAGTAGLTPTVWSPVHEQWGAIQLQNRFAETFSRWMRADDMNAWTAVRMIGEAATRAATADTTAIAQYLLGDAFSIAAFKGEKLTLRDWDRQLRQPILLSDRQTVVSVSPQEGFLHQSSYLDTLGYDEPESQCRF